MDAARSTAVRAAELDAGDVGAQARRVSADLRSGALPAPDANLWAVLGSAAHAQALGREPGEWEQRADAACELGDLLPHAALVRVACAVLRLGRDGFERACSIDSPEWVRVWWVDVSHEITEANGHEFFSATRLNAWTPGHGMRRVLMQGNPRGVTLGSIGDRVSTSGLFCDQGDGKALALRELRRTLGRIGGVPEAGPVRATAAFVEQRLARWEDGSAFVAPSMLHEVRRLGLSWRTEWAAALPRLMLGTGVRPELLRALGGRRSDADCMWNITDEELHDATRGHGYWLQRQVQSAAHMVGSGKAVRDLIEGTLKQTGAWRW